MTVLSIISVSVNSPEWAELLVKSIRHFTRSFSYEIIIVDNGSLDKNLEWLRQQKDVVLLEMKQNRGHGGAMDIGTAIAKSRYVCVLDIDAHIQRPGWEFDLFKMYNETPNTRLIGCYGPEHKPLHPPLFFYERDFILRNGIHFKYIPGEVHATDTAQKAYWDIKDLGYEVLRLQKGRKFYACSGDQIWINDKATIFHHWYGVRFQENNPGHTKSELDGYTLERYLENKNKLFNESLVKEILSSS